MDSPDTPQAGKAPTHRPRHSPDAPQVGKAPTHRLMHRAAAPPPAKASSHHLMDNSEAPPGTKASSHGAGRPGLLQPPQPPQPHYRLHRATADPVAPPPDKASSHRSVEPFSQGLLPPSPQGQPGRAAASWAAIVSSQRPAAPSSQDLPPLPPPPPPPPPHGQPRGVATSFLQPPRRAVASWAAIVSSATPVKPSSQDPYGQPAQVTSRYGLRYAQPRQAAGLPHAQPRQAAGLPHAQPRQAAGLQASIMVSPDISPAGKASSYRYPNWVMLDPHTRLNYQPKEDFLGTHAVTETSMGEHIYVSFRTVTPPGASRIYVSWTPRGHTKGESSSGKRGEDRWDQFNEHEPIVVAAHGNSILLQLTFQNTQSDFFVYSLLSTGPYLMLLPSCNHKFTDGITCSSGFDHMSVIEEIGLLCNAEREKFVVADLIILPSAYKDDDAPVVAELCVLQGIQDGRTITPWRAIRPQIHHDKEQGKELVWWETDAVVPLRDSLCYVDYFRGIFFVDVLSKNPQLHYVRLPVMIPNGNPVDPETGLRGCPELYRSVCVTNDGCVLKFVEVVTTTVFVSGSRAPASSSFSIKVWKLTQDSMTWEKEYVMDDAELWALQGYGDLLRVSPSFPFVSMEEPDVVYFVLTNRCSNDAGASWVIVVDMLKKTMRSLSRYNKVYPNCIGSDDDMASASLTTNSAFIPCSFSKYLHVRACV